MKTAIERAMVLTKALAEVLSREKGTVRIEIKEWYQETGMCCVGIFKPAASGDGTLGGYAGQKGSWR